MWEDGWVDGVWRGERGGWGVAGRGWVDREDAGIREVVRMDDMCEGECVNKQMWGRGMGWKRELWWKGGRRDGAGVRERKMGR
jgi:hypothetical protein